MLKIKDNVDLKELEKFGFEKDEYGDYVKKFKAKNFPSFINTNIVAIMVDMTDKRHLRRIGYVCDNKYCFDIELNILYDLIKADLVEKVEDKGE